MSEKPSLPPEVDATVLKTNGRQLHFLCPSGIGDSLWIMSKLLPIAKERNATFWYPEGEQNRAGQYADLVGAPCGYLKGLRTQWIWSQPGSPPIPKKGGVLVVQANRHLETGRHLRDWYPELPLQYPKPVVRVRDTFTHPFVLAFIGQRQYMGLLPGRDSGNLRAAEWARILLRIQGTIAPVRLVGAAKDVEFIHDVRRKVPQEAPDILDQPFKRVVAATRNPMCRLGFGVAGGPLIAAQCEGCPTWFGYPYHLWQMPGTWERPGVPWWWCFVDELEEAVRKGRVERLAR